MSKLQLLLFYILVNKKRQLILSLIYNNLINTPQITVLIRETGREKSKRKPVVSKLHLFVFYFKKYIYKKRATLAS
jgi:hypothetical protein